MPWAVVPLLLTQCTDKNRQFSDYRVNTESSATLGFSLETNRRLYSDRRIASYYTIRAIKAFRHLSDRVGKRDLPLNGP
jgi:hypothetical protein